jgi:deazaflavin-dependent oxidoreductase (nitroreductase family)
VKPGETEFLYLTTTGRRSGQPRQIEIWFTQGAGRYYVIAEHLLESHWVQNVLADPRVSVRVDGEMFAARARVIEAAGEPDLHERVQERSEKKYGWGDGLVVELTPDPFSGSAPDSAAG